MCRCWIHLTARRIFGLLLWHQQRSCWDESDVCPAVPRLPCRALGCPKRLMFLKMWPEVAQKNPSGRRVKSGMPFFSKVWDIFSYFLIKVEFRSPLGRNGDRICVPSLLISSLMAQSASPAQGMLGLALAKGCALLSRVSSRSAGTLKVTHQKTKCSRGEFILSGRAGCHIRTAAPGVKWCHPEAGVSGEYGHSLGWDTFACRAWAPQVLFADSYNPFGKGWTFLLCPRNTPTVPKLQIRTSSCASQCLAVAPCLADHGEFSLLSELLLLLLLALSLFMRVLPGCFFRLFRKRLFTNIHYGSCVTW